MALEESVGSVAFQQTMVFTRAHAQAHASCEARFAKTLHFLHWLNQDPNYPIQPLYPRA